MSKKNKQKEVRPRIRGNKEDIVELSRIINEIGSDKGLKLLQGVDAELSTEYLLERDIALRRYKAKIGEDSKKYRLLLQKFEELDNLYNSVLLIEDSRVNSAFVIADQRLKIEAAAIAQFSDWHVGEVVERKTVYGLNEYNPDIAKKRAEKLVNNLIKQIREQRNQIKINTLVLHLGGDFIGGWIHPELEQTNYFSPIDETVFASSLLTPAIKSLINHGKFKKIICVCSLGNHGRFTKKMQFNNAKGTNFETLLYSDLIKTFDDYDCIEFVFPDSYLAYVDIFGATNRFHHGEKVRYNGGVGGISPSLNKINANWDKTQQADFNFMCHFHTYSQPNSNTRLNGSLKGYDPYAATHGFKFEEPKQSFQLLDTKKRMILSAPIFAE